MAIMKFYTLEDLKATKLPMFASTIYPDVEIGQVYLSDEVISMWDFNFSSRKGKYVYYDDVGGRPIQNVVRVCKRIDETTTQCVILNEDLSNLNVFDTKESK